MDLIVISFLIQSLCAAYYWRQAELLGVEPLVALDEERKRKRLIFYRTMTVIHVATACAFAYTILAR